MIDFEHPLFSFRKKGGNMTCREHYDKLLQSGKIVFKSRKIIKSFQSYREFKKLDNRRKSLEYDFGVMWHREAFPLERWRVSWIKTTGELYAVCFSYFYNRDIDSVCVLLGCIPELEAVKERMVGWDFGFKGNVLEVFFPYVDWGMLELGKVSSVIVNRKADK